MEKVDLKVANKVFINNNFTLKQEYQSKIEKVFHSSVEPFDVSKPKQAASDINKWVSDATHHKIKNFIDECNS